MREGGFFRCGGLVIGVLTCLRPLEDLGVVTGDDGVDLILAAILGDRREGIVSGGSDVEDLVLFLAAILGDRRISIVLAGSGVEDLVLLLAAILGDRLYIVS